MNTKQKRTTVRMTPEEHARLNTYATECGVDRSTYIRMRVLENIDRIFFDPSMIAELRAYREVIRGMTQDIAKIRQKVEASNFVKQEELLEVQRTIRAIYDQMVKLNQSVDLYRKELENGDYKAAEN